MAKSMRRSVKRPGRGGSRDGRVSAKGEAHSAGAQPGSARTVVYVHGIGNKPLPSVLKCQWDCAVFGFDLGERSRMAYWVNRAYYPAPTPGTCASGDRVELEEEPTGAGITVAKHLKAVSIGDEVAALNSDPRKQAVLRQIAQKVGRAPVVARSSVAASGVQAKILPLPGPVRAWLTRKITRAFLRDVNDFLFVPERRSVMRESLLSRLRVGGGPFVVIAHSQGSMIAYDVLSQMDAAEIDVPLFVTIGSPLGIQEVQDRLKKLTAQSVLRVPPCVRRWINVADRLDPVAADPRLMNDYAATNGVGVEDHLEWNNDSPWHPHSGTGYLSLPVVRQAAREMVETGLFQQVAPFVVARDLVRSLENLPPEIRHPVLIELADADAKLGNLDEKRTAVLDAIRGLTRGNKSVRITSLRRFVSADLTREETETLAAKLGSEVLSRAAAGMDADGHDAEGSAALSLRRIWRNAPKRALIDRSSHTVQAVPAHTAYQATGRGILWAVMDSGINDQHEHFRPFSTIEGQYDCTRPGDIVEGQPALDGHGHGTHVAGIIAGRMELQGRDGRTRLLTGMAPQARLRIYKVLNDDGGGEDASIIKALDHVATTNENAGRLVIHGINLSLGGGFDQSVFACGHSPLCMELRRLWRQGVLVVIAAGNEGFAVLQSLDGTVDANMDLTIADPGNLDEAIVVGSVHKTSPHIYGVSYFSSRGPTADGRQKPDLVAPGERILSCRHRTRPGRNVDDLYVEMSGTSMAAPHVSGILAAFLSMRGEFLGYPDRVKDLLLENCTDLRRDRPQQGAGLPNLIKMLVGT